MQDPNLNKIITNKAKELGFNFIGFTSPDNNQNNKLEKWLDFKYHASMKWMETSKDKREDIFKYFPEVKTIISFAYNYYTDQNKIDEDKYKISNYAWGNDYHIVLKEKLYQIIDLISSYNDKFEYRVCVDTSPVMEKYWAQKSGIGWIGKHTNLINNKIGSWFFLSEILLNFKLEYDKPFVEDLCGTCTKCIDECPTDAIVDEYVLDSNKCISYLTIEHRDKLPENYVDNLDNWIYGCDICQQVCPWNEKFSIVSSDYNFIVRDKIKNKDKKDWENLTIEDYQDTFKKSAIKRTKFRGLKRNISANKK